ncbi:hypothetical protein BB560_005360 [Smittium megazygosporum]|uniref:cAMP-independent regulatory protein pac2 n=1 Tax=Smittium megazygosporum TaxID=133381 RepID=A0A2T9Z6U5_9FUNG|nr:hypothetical protein BB560_005360 [Smittium megazygosporum]
METYNGYIDTTNDALLVLEACRTGLLKPVQRRLSEDERLKIKSGSIFVWDEELSGIKRWTDGKSWSPSRVNGCFLTYNELERKKSSSSSDINTKNLSSDDEHRSLSSQDNGQISGNTTATGSCDSGLIKKALSVFSQFGNKLHLICYYKKEYVVSGKLKTPSKDPLFENIVIPPGMYPEMVPELVHNMNDAFPFHFKNRLMLHQNVPFSQHPVYDTLPPPQKPNFQKNHAPFKPHPPSLSLALPLPVNSSFPAQKKSLSLGINPQFDHHKPGIVSPTSAHSEYIRSSSTHYLNDNAIIHPTSAKSEHFLNQPNSLYFLDPSPTFPCPESPKQPSISSAKPNLETLASLAINYSGSSSHEHGTNNKPSKLPIRSNSLSYTNTSPKIITGSNSYTDMKTSTPQSFSLNPSILKHSLPPIPKNPQPYSLLTKEDRRQLAALRSTMFKI